jgi:maltose alpha-D-glucosyltransferase/alpha-amylase
MPIFPTGGGDDGYDVTDYCAVDPRLGTMADFSEFMVEAKERGFHVILDLIPNHTSDKHPWFQAARKSRKSAYRDYYVWRDDDPGDTSDKVVFPGEQDGIWSYDEAAKAWYLHRFYPFQPDLNFSSHAVRDEFRRIMGLWLQQGIDGFRIDAAPVLQDEQGGPETAHKYLQEMRDFAVSRKGNAVLLAETYLASGRADAILVGGGEAMHEALYLAFDRLESLARDGATYAPGVEGSRGMRLGEGAAFVTLEREDAEQARGGRTLARLVGYGTSFEPPEREAQLLHVDAGAIERAVRSALADAGASPGDVQR